MGWGRGGANLSALRSLFDGNWDGRSRDPAFRRRPQSTVRGAFSIVFMLFFWSITRIKRPKRTHWPDARSRRASRGGLTHWRSEPEHPNPATLHQIGPHAEFRSRDLPPRARPRVRSQHQHRAPRWSDRRLRGHPLGSGGSTCTLWNEQDVLTWPAPVAHPAVGRAKRVASPIMMTRGPRSTRAAHTSVPLLGLDQGGEAQEQCEDEDLRHQLHGHLLQHARAPACVREGQTRGESSARREKRECERCERRISSRGECMGRSGGMYTDGGRHARAWE